MRFVPSLVVIGSLIVVACSSESSNPSSSSGATSSSGGSSSGASSSGGSSSGGSSSGGSSGTPVDAGVGNCQTFVDKTADDAARVLIWDTTLFNKPERCMKVKVGQKVKFTSDGAAPADFGSHPIGANGGDASNPVTTVDTTTGELTLPSAGTFGFMCTIHPSMIGAFEVVP